jgi:hypothetical protein
MSVSFTNDVISHVVCQINMCDLMMNVQICVTENTSYTMLFVCLILTCRSAIQHGMRSVISNTCVYIHHQIKDSDMT